MPKIKAYAGVLLGLVLGSNAYAAKNEEVIHYPSLLMFGQVSQSLGVSYSFAQHLSNGSSSSSNSLRERYSISTVAAILDPHLVNLQIMGGLSYSQQFGQPVSKLLDGEYNITASAFDTSYHPVTFTSARTTTLVSNGYLPTYSITNNTNQVSAALLNIKVPVQFFYVHTSSDTVGMPQNNSSVSDAAGISLHHDILDLTNTNLSLSTNGTRSGDSSSVGYSANLNNNLSLDKAHRYRLATSANITDMKSDGTPQRNAEVGSELSMTLGPALFANIADRFSYNSTVDLSSQSQTQSTNTASASLSHRLYQSLLTSVSVSASNGSALGGDTSSYSGSGRVTYTKRLPGRSNLTVAADVSRSVSSQDLPRSQFVVPPENHLRVAWGDHIVPYVAGRLVEKSVEVRSADGVTLYNKGTDYEINYELGYIEILTAGNIVPGSDIAISYTVQVNPSIRYETDGVSTSANLTLVGGRYNLGGSYSVQNQKLLSGEANNQALVSSKSLNLRADANFEETLFGMEYGRMDSTQETSSHVAAYATHTLRTTGNAVMAFSVRDTFSMLDSASSGRSSSNQNSLSASASYSRRIFEWINFNTSLSGDDSRSSTNYSDFIGLRAGLSGGYNQLQVTLSGQYLYRIAGSSTSQDRNVTITVTRYF